MDKIEVTDTGATTVDAASNEAVSALGDKVKSPVIISWFDSKENTFAPDIPGGDPKYRWRDYGESFGGSYEIVIDGRFHFIVIDSEGFAESKSKFVNMTDKSGRQYLCIDPSCSADTRRPLGEAHAAGGGKGG